MDLNLLKWTKNVKDQGDKSKWAYSLCKVHDPFKLAWKDNEDDARRPDKDDLILLRQRGYVTHLVKILNYKPERESGKGDYDIYRIVEVLWTIDFVHPPASAKADKMFDYSAVLHYEGGNVMKLDDLPTFKSRWDIDGGLKGFQNHIQNLLD